MKKPMLILLSLALALVSCDTYMPHVPAHHLNPAPTPAAAGSTRGASRLVVAALGQTTSGNGIPGATVTVTLADSGMRYEQSTDRNGKATFQIPQGEKFRVSIVLAGFVPIELGPIDGLESDSWLLRAQLEVQPQKAVVVE